MRPLSTWKVLLAEPLLWHNKAVHHFDVCALRMLSVRVWPLQGRGHWNPPGGHLCLVGRATSQASTSCFPPPPIFLPLIRNLRIYIRLLLLALLSPDEMRVLACYRLTPRKIMTLWSQLAYRRTSLQAVIFSSVYVQSHKPIMPASTIRTITPDSEKKQIWCKSFSVVTWSIARAYITRSPSSVRCNREKPL